MEIKYQGRKPGQSGLEASWIWVSGTSSEIEEMYTWLSDNLRGRWCSENYGLSSVMVGFLEDSDRTIFNLDFLGTRYEKSYS